MTELFEVIMLAEAKERIMNHLSWPQRQEDVSILNALNRCLALDVVAPENVPSFNRSTVDGFAVRAKDTFGASESLPVYLKLTGEVLMGTEPQKTLKEEQAWLIPTGGMLPPGSDAVVMVEYSEEISEQTIGIVKPAAPGENVIYGGEDVVAGSLVLPKGHYIQPQDLGILAALGITTVRVRCLKQVGIISTGDEVILPTAKPRPGQVRDINSYTLYGAVLQAGGKPRLYGIVADDFIAIKKCLSLALAENDLVLISGGSSVGSRDIVTKVMENLGKPGILFHGLSLKPGRPTIGAVIKGKPVFGLPGHPASALVVFDQLVAPLIIKENTSLDEVETGGFSLWARLTRNLSSAVGREDFVWAKLYRQKGELLATPVLGKSGLISTLVKANGLIKIPAGKEGVKAGEVVEAKLFDFKQVLDKEL